jgi:hypothetical protein
MLAVVRCYLTRLSAGSQIKLATLFGVAAADLGTDVAYVLTQPYDNVYLLASSGSFILAPSLVYLYASGAAGRFSRSLVPFYADVWFALYCMRRWALDRVKRMLHNAGDVVCTHIAVFLYLLAILLVFFPLVLVTTLAFSLVAPVLMLAVYLLSINLKLPIFGQLWALINQSMTLDVVRVTRWIGAPAAPSPPTFTLSKLKEHYHQASPSSYAALEEDSPSPSALPPPSPLPRRNRILDSVGNSKSRQQVVDVNQAVLSEVVCESLPQLIAITANEILLRGVDFAANFEYQIAAVFSTLLIVHAVFGTTYYSLMSGWDWQAAIEVPVTPLDEEQELMAGKAREWLRKQPLCACWRAILSAIDDEEEEDRKSGSAKDLRRMVGTATDVGEGVLEAGVIGVTAVGLTAGATMELAA